MHIAKRNIRHVIQDEILNETLTLKTIQEVWIERYGQCFFLS